MTDTKDLGNLGERIACEYLVGKGFKILGRNYRISFGEIDIIAQKKWKLRDLFRKNPSIKSGQAIHFVEVKTLLRDTHQGRPNTDFFPEGRVDYKKQKKLIGLCQIWLEKNKFPQNYPYQIDVIGISIDSSSKKAKINYFANVVEDLS